VIGVVALAGFLVQVLSWCLLALIFGVGKAASLPKALGWPVLLVVFVLPLAGVGYALYRYVTWVGTGQGVVTTAFLGGLLIKTFLIPFIKGIVTGAGFKLFMRWLRGGKPKSA
jgi:hypothetical protein